MSLVFSRPRATPTARTTGQRLARRRDRRVYLASHPLLFAVLTLARRRPVRRVRDVVVVTGTDEVREVLTRLPLDRTAEGTTGGVAARALGEGDLLFDQDGAGHRTSRRALGAALDSRGVERLRPVWTPVLDEAAARLAAGETVDVVRLAADVAGRTAAALLGRGDVDPLALADAARAVAAAAVSEHLPSLRRRSVGDDLEVVLGAAAEGREHMLTVATVNTTVAAYPRAVAWAADAGLWDDAGDPARCAVLATELLRVTAASPVLPRVAAADGQAGGCPVHAGDRVVLVARDAAHAPWRDPSVHDPAPAAVSQLVFGAGPHACPGAGLARAQLLDLLARLAPFAPEVVSARVDRRSALPSWRSLTVRATRGNR